MRAISRNDRSVSTYQRKFAISKHALDRFRERVDEEFQCRDDQDLGNLLDEKLRNFSKNQYTVRDPRAPSDITYLFEIEMRKTGTFYVVVRNETAVTVLDPDMARRNFGDQWGPTLNAPFNTNSLKKVMQDVQAAPSKIKLTPRDEAILRGAEIPLPVNGTAPEPTPLEAAGIKHARARRHFRDCEQAVARARDALAQAEATLQEAAEQRDAAQRELDALVDGDVP